VEKLEKHLYDYGFAIIFRHGIKGTAIKERIDKFV
jgi:hypothetical protein